MRGSTLTGPRLFLKLPVLHHREAKSRFVLLLAVYIPNYVLNYSRCVVLGTEPAYLQGVQTLSEKSNLLTLSIQNWSFYDSLDSN